MKEGSGFSEHITSRPGLDEVDSTPVRRRERPSFGLLLQPLAFIVLVFEILIRLLPFDFVELLIQVHSLFLMVRVVDLSEHWVIF